MRIRAAMHGPRGDGTRSRGSLHACASWLEPQRMGLWPGTPPVGRTRSSSNSARSFALTSPWSDGERTPSSRSNTSAVTVISRCNRSVDRPRNPVAGKSGWEGSRTRSEGSGSPGGWLVMNPSATCRCEPTAAVRHTAGRTLDADRSSKGKRTRTTLPFIGQRPAIGSTVEVLSGIAEKRKRRVPSGGATPLVLRQFLPFRDQQQHPHTAGPINGNRLIDVQPVLLIDLAREFDRFHRTLCTWQAVAAQPMNARPPIHGPLRQPQQRGVTRPAGRG